MEKVAPGGQAAATASARPQLSLSTFVNLPNFQVWSFSHKIRAPKPHFAKPNS